ncbi:MAG: response regulator, partial [Cyanobacteriota bacterium]|nr:response regulator [Cyanobacteriota bacterium]
MKILLVEDDEGLARAVREVLVAQHYLVDSASDGQSALDLADAFEYDLILLDLLLPKLDGIAFCQQRRDRRDRTPILLMTARDDSELKVRGLDAGADDYLVKPFDLEELLARVRALLRRGNDSLPPAIEWGELRLNPRSCEVTYEGKILKLTAKEYGLVELFLRNPHRIFSQSALLDHLWSFEEPPSENAVRTQIKGLRQKLKAAGTADAIETVYGLGYRLNPQSEGASKRPASSPALDTDRLNEIWERHREGYVKRATIIERAIAAWQQGSLDTQLQQQARQEAHTLAGSLGSFGLEVASRAARQLESIFTRESPLEVKQGDRAVELIAALKRDIGEHSGEVKGMATVPPTPERRAWSVEGARLLIVDDDLALAETLAAGAIAEGMEVELSDSPAKARQAIARSLPDVVLLDLSFPDSTEAGFEFLQELAQTQPALPVIVFTAKESFAARVKVARLGGRGFLHKPIAPFEVLEAIARVLQQSHPSVAKILAVDDDPHLLDLLRSLLEPWGFQPILLEDPRQFWATLERENPDLLLLDIQMPELSGIELCQVARNDPQWQDLPILMLSAHRNSEVVQQVFIAGADDYIQKPIVEPELVARILNRLERSRKLVGRGGDGERG